MLKKKIKLSVYLKQKCGEEGTEVVGMLGSSFLFLFFSFLKSRNKGAVVMRQQSSMIIELEY